MLPSTLRPVRQSRPARASTAFCLAVAEWMVLISACLMPKVSLMTLVMGARQLVVQEALDTTSISGVYFRWLTPMTKVGITSSLEGAEIMTFFAPFCKWALAFSTVLNAPVDSMMYSAPQSSQGICVMSLSL